jgi:biotin synthase
MYHREIIAWLRETDETRLTQLWQRADDTRRQYVGGEVHLRGLVELSNHCVRLCGYCGLRVENHNLQRYRLSDDEIMDCASKAVAFGYGTVVLQSGEDPGITLQWMSLVIRRIKSETPLAVTLSLGERDEKELAAWRRAGADRYLLRFETSNRALYERIHPPRPGVRSDRIALLKRLRELGYEIGSGVMIGIPGQTYEDLARDIELFAALDLDMIGVGPYLPHPDTPLADTINGGLSQFSSDENGTVPLSSVSPDQQAPNTELMTYKVMALARLAAPRANIPATTALATLNAAAGRELGLMRGANIVMPNLTPPQYRALYEIYPQKACILETTDACNTCLQALIRALGRESGAGRGDSPNYAKQRGNADVPSAAKQDTANVQSVTKLTVGDNCDCLSAKLTVNDNIDRLAADGSSA